MKGRSRTNGRDEDPWEWRGLFPAKTMLGDRNDRGLNLAAPVVGGGAEMMW